MAVETIGNWYWIVDEIEEAGMVPRLVHPRKAKLMMGSINKTDKLDARGMNLLQRNGTLPVVWIPPGTLRDFRDLPRTRMVLVQQRTRIKNRIHATLAKCALGIFEGSDIFGKKTRETLCQEIRRLPPQTQYATGRLMRHLDSVEDQIEALEKRIRKAFEKLPGIALLTSLPGVGFILPR